MQTHKDSFPKWPFRMILGVALLLLCLWLLRYGADNSLRVAVGKGGPLLDSAPLSELSASQAMARDIALSDAGLTSLFSGRDFGFLYALPLDTAELRSGIGQGCEAGQCMRVTFYDYVAGGTVEAIVDLDSGQVQHRLTNPQVRPGASAQVVPRALAIAAADSRVQDVLGDVRMAEPMMVPMSAWLIDDACRQDWCVDLTYQAPDGSGRVFHVFVNMEQEEVARVFYSRARADRSYDRPVAQGPDYTDGCHEQYGWSVCWEMTAHDGVNFYDATYQGNLVFSNAKIGQVEVFYPSWPGGYRDEIGFASSVPPAYDTHVTDLANGFEVRQLFTEFLSWPNCVCCYRYEQVHRFYADGAFELQFVSHGPGCDDVPIFRAFWRIDLDLGGEQNDEVWYWDNGEWTEAQTEVELPLFGNLSPNSEKLYTTAGDMAYKWFPKATDPLGRDEGLLFALRWHQFQGEDAIAPGPADSFTPPRQWLDNEALRGENLVIWYLPILNALKSEPYWCVPDPEPEFSPCNALIRAEPAGELVRETPEPTTPADTPVPTLPPALTPTPAPTSTPRPIAGDTAEELIVGGGCASCHLIGTLGEAGKVGPDLSNIGDVADQRVPGLSADEYLRQSILEPNAFIVTQCPNGPCLEGIMPRDFDQRLTAEQVDLLVTFLLEQTTAPRPIAETRPAPTSPAAEQEPPENRPVPFSPITLLVLISVLVLLPLLVRWWRRRAAE